MFGAFYHYAHFPNYNLTLNIISCRFKNSFQIYILHETETNNSSKQPIIQKKNEFPFVYLYSRAREIKTGQLAVQRKWLNK